MSLTHDVTLTDVEVSVLTPWTKTVSGSLSTRYDVMPVTSTVELEWKPGRKMVMKGSAVLSDWNSTEISTTVKTTLPGVKVSCVVTLLDRILES